MTEQNHSQTEKKKSKFVIDVTSSDGDLIKINIPLRLVSMVNSLIPKNTLSELESSGIDIKNVLSNLSEFEEMDDDIINIQGADGNKVRIYIQR